MAGRLSGIGRSTRRGRAGDGEEMAGRQGEFDRVERRGGKGRGREF